ncbi:hypothetical protein D3C76_1498300 [compost metagenome]
MAGPCDADKADIGLLQRVVHFLFLNRRVRVQQRHMVELHALGLVNSGDVHSGSLGILSVFWKGIRPDKAFTQRFHINGSIRVSSAAGS